jgi:hypothetical protein
MIWLRLTPETGQYNFETDERNNRCRRGRVQPHVREWLIVNVKGEWEEQTKVFSDNPDGALPYVSSPVIGFEDERDAVLFKTFWL